MITDELQLKEILSNTAIIAKQVDDVENSMRTELRAYNANMDNLAKVKLFFRKPENKTISEYNNDYRIG